MCGIGALIGVRDEGLALARRLRASLAHRGPDDRGIEQPAPEVILVHTRLAVIELSAEGHQPMADRPVDPNGSPNWIVFNGEIYNYRELRRELCQRGWNPRTRTDTEAILGAYREWGEEFVSRLRGMFAFCLVDPARGLAHLSRDRLGIKPLYLFRPRQGGLVLASELRAILALAPELVTPYVDRRGLESFFAQGAVQGPATFIDGITMLEPARHLMVSLEDGKEVRRRRYWELPQGTAEPPQRGAAVERLRPVLDEAIRLHLISDAPLGLFLSAGIDSNALLALASQLVPAGLRAITVGFEARDFDESAHAAGAARQFGAQHQVLMLSEDELIKGFDDGLCAMDQPTVDGLNTYFVSRCARQAGLTVALSGLGGDELFGGYHSFVAVPRAVALGRVAPLRVLARVGAPLIRNRFGVKLAESATRRPDALSLYLLRRELFLPLVRRRLHPLPAGCDPQTGVEEELLDELRRRAQGLDPVNQVSFFELELYMRHMLLRDADAFSMSAPIEYRVPFLDHRLVEEVFALPGAWKVPDPRPKPLLLDALRPRLPEATWRQPKRGFAFPWRQWLAPNGPLAPQVGEALADGAVWRDLGIDPAGVSALGRRFARGDRRMSPLEPLAFVVLRDFARRHRLRAA